MVWIRVRRQQENNGPFNPTTNSTLGFTWVIQEIVPYNFIMCTQKTALTLSLYLKGLGHETEFKYMDNNE